MRHTPQCRILVHSDAAKRIADEYNLHRCAGGADAIGRWAVFALEDGSSDHVLYDSKHAAVTHQHHNEQRMLFLQISPNSMYVCDAEAFLAVQRKLYDSGVRLTDPDHRSGGRTVIPRLAAEDQRAQILSILSGGKLRPSNIRYGSPRE